MITRTTHPSTYESGYWLLFRNAARCDVCGDHIESRTGYDFRSCGCGNVSVDGGREYVRRCYTGAYTDDNLWALHSEDGVKNAMAYYAAKEGYEKFVEAGKTILKEYYS